MVRRPTAAFALLLGLFALGACAPDNERGPSLKRSGGDTTEAPAQQETPATSSGEDYVEPDTQDGPSEIEPPTATSPAVKKELSFTWLGQQNGYFCGPGSTRIALSVLVKQLPSQNELADLLDTTTEGTSDIGKVCKVLNNYIANAGYVTREISDPPSPAQRDQLKKDVVARIGAGFPLVANVISGWRPPGYPSGTIYHYVVVVGYDDSGEKALIADPAAEGSAGATWKNVKRTYWVSMDDLATWIGGKGYSQ